MSFHAGSARVNHCHRCHLAPAGHNGYALRKPNITTRDGAPIAMGKGCSSRCTVVFTLRVMTSFLVGYGCTASEIPHEQPPAHQHPRCERHTLCDIYASTTQTVLSKPRLQRETNCHLRHGRRRLVGSAEQGSSCG